MHVPVFLAVFAVVLFAALGIGLWFGVKVRRHSRDRTREVWQSFADEHDLEFVEADEPELFEKHDGYNRYEMRGRYDGEPIDFRVRWRHRRDENLSLVTIAETTIEQVPSDLVVYDRDAARANHWDKTGDAVDTELDEFPATLAARASDVPGAVDFLRRPGVPDALERALTGESRAVLEGNELRFVESGFLDDPDDVRRYADALAATRRTLRRAVEDPDPPESADEPSETDDSEPDPTDDDHVAEW